LEFGVGTARVDGGCLGGNSPGVVLGVSPGETGALMDALKCREESRSRWSTADKGQLWLAAVRPGLPVHLKRALLSLGGSAEQRAPGDAARRRPSSCGFQVFE